MDLVDIDKVLDDLELNEDDRTMPERKASGSEIGKKRNNSQNRPNIQGTVPKTFVNITNVFSSLSEYVNVDIDHSVKTDIEITNEDNNPERVTEESAKDLEEDDSTQPSSLSPSHPDKEDYNEFTENRTNDEDVISEEDPDIDNLTSASSITTSSPSSFSSGPSPGCSSDTGSLISGTDEKASATKDEIVSEDKQKLELNGESSLTKDQISSENAPETGNKEDVVNENNSPEIGLSTISSCLYNENTSSSLPGLSHDLIKIDALSSISSQSPAEDDDDDDKDKTFSEQNEVADLNIKYPTNIPQQQVESRQQLDTNNVIGFGSTMDEISDTELDSILQEIDSDLQSFIPVPENTIPDVNDEICNESSSSPQPDAKRSTCEDEHNADSFSQASTIEFAESRLHSDFGTEVVNIAITDERSTSTNSGTRNEQPPNPTEEDISQKDNSATSKQLQRPNSLDLPAPNSVAVNINSNAGQTPPASRLDDTSALSTSSSEEIPQPSIASVQNPMASTSGNTNSKLGKIPPFWIPDSEANACMQCKLKFSLLKRRHHCRACGQVLCSVCCSQKAKLEFLGDSEVRICVQCHVILIDQQPSTSEVDTSEEAGPSNRPPNPNNPMEYCSMIPPHQQVAAQTPHTPISVMVPVGVLKREGAPKNNRKDKNVIFSDGIRPGCDLTELDNSWDDKGASGSSFRKPGTSKRNQSSSGNSHRSIRNAKATPNTDETGSYIPEQDNALPPIYIKTVTDYEYSEVKNNAQLITKLQNETLKFAVQRNFYVFVKIAKLKCCINKTVINFTTHGMHHVGQDEIVILLETDNSNLIPKEIFTHLNEIYCDADKGHPINELGFSLPKAQNFLGSREHGGFLYIRSTFQCLQEIHLPESPFLIGILIHRWEVPWAKNFPLRLMLRLGAQYRYYPSPHVSIRGRDSVYAEIAQTIINFLADFRNYSYTLATIRGMYIHMEDRKTSVLIPKNRYDQVVKALNNSSDHILALGANFSKKADGHLVCMQNMESDCQEAHTYSTQAINIQGQPRKVTGASFLVLNGALKSSTGLSGKCSIVEDGLMVQILPAKMTTVRNSLRNMKDIEITCGPLDAEETQTENVCITWTDNDTEFNIGVKSPIDSKKMDGIPSIRVHFGLNCSNSSHTIRWTEVFVIKTAEETAHGEDPVDISKLSENIARSTSNALVSFLDLLVASGCVKIGLRATLHQENVCYEAGSQNMKLAPLYMNALDNELIPTLHGLTTILEIDTPIILELIFHILDK